MTVGGLHGFSTDLSVDPSWKHLCSYSSGKSGVALFTDSDPATDFLWILGPNGYGRYILLDLGDGRTLLVDVEAQNKADFDALPVDAIPLISTFQFSR